MIIEGIKEELLHFYVKLKQKDYNNFMFRIFSSYIYKPGVDYHVASMSLLIFSFVFLLFFFTLMIKETTNPLQIFSISTF